ncbi:unnamed protein product [Moneuplotes crassus]|uniref:Uncharacterized protein n=1 Tax=Euplotes crassus TaxID=5936 RepID=A0AAD1UB05_EUPCR|nr:unnamed protein product [Moneuplotes crassus]
MICTEYWIFSPILDAFSGTHLEKLTYGNGVYCFCQGFCNIKYSRSNYEIYSELLDEF